MTDIILSPDCDDDDDDDKHGKRGRRGKRGHTGPPGPASSGSGGLLKFSGVVEPAGELGAAETSYLADWGTGVGAGAVITTAPSYPVAVAHSLVNMSTNLLGGAVVPSGGTVVFQLLKNGIAVPGFTTTYTGPSGGIMSVVAGPVAYAIGDTFDVSVTASGTVETFINASATVGVE